ncbi:DUF2911 domain-containing protein [Aurantibacillus circumpalustris]|uniref:DUF2911 domain-containing protein n=1 Tax=Aurantibacillus circumpalustris TaxID=3036359 RepID=UPI00295AC1F2|nr:DUF2911 domain-containing protein [Aurantibacillus circumpalustris]
MKSYSLKTAAIFTLALFISLTSLGQKKIASPRDSASGKISKALISINYGSPSVKGRKIWGDLVPYGKVWRAGANEATTFTTNQNIKVEGKDLPAGTYGFFAIPGEKDWIIIFNKTAQQWGAYEYKEKDDLIRVTVNAGKSSSMNERLIYKVTASGVSLLWENIEVAFAIK